MDVDRQSRCAKGAETLSGRAGGMYDNGVCRQSLQIIAFRDFRAEHGAHRALDIANRQFKLNRPAAFDGRPAYFDQTMIQGIFQAV